jgi:hypothetical protein
MKKINSNKNKPNFKTDIIFVTWISMYLILILLNLFNIIPYNKFIDIYGIAVLGCYLISRTMRKK